MNSPALPVLSLVLAVLVLSACESPAYIYEAQEFNRRSKGFAKDILDRTKVTICYDKSDSTPQGIFNMATEECNRFGKSARFLKQDRKSCPLATPISVSFSCVK